MTYLHFANLVMFEQALCTAPLHKQWDAVLSILEKDGLDNDSEPMSDFGLGRRILEAGDDMVGKWLHDVELCKRM